MRATASAPRRSVRPNRTTAFFSLLIGWLLILAGCTAPRLQEQRGEFRLPRLTVEKAVMDDGYQLPLRHWGQAQGATALVLALHGFNDYGNAFAGLGPYLAASNILTYAYDQRGFGATAQRGRWAGEDRMIADLITLTTLLRRRHTELPLYLLGESMGGAVVMAAAAHATAADGIILVAPAVWPRDTMNPLQRFGLWAASSTVPWLELTGRGLDIRPSDNLDMLRTYSADPLVIKKTRVDALWGITNMMDRASSAAGYLSRPALVLYGARDEIIPRRAFCVMLDTLPEGQSRLRLAIYRDGWHMLTRDLQGERVMADIAAWLTDPHAALPSGEEVKPGSQHLEQFCPEGPASMPRGDTPVPTG
ncbi:MAG: alpha/beta fold hydrolase [Pseudomonadota bacterium]|nr:alpha/beta fold hydrolase [Pseudomonadota bacterium]